MPFNWIYPYPTGLLWLAISLTMMWSMAWKRITLWRGPTETVI